MDLTDRPALVTGASSGIGKATAIALAAEGARVGLAARREAGLKAVANEIETRGGETVAVPTDLRDETQVDRLVETIKRTFDGLEILVNGAGVLHPAPVAEADLSEWREEIEVNLLGTMYVTHHAVAAMLAQGTGHVVTISSKAGRRAYPRGSGYTAAKFGLTGFSEALREEVMEAGIRVTLIEPGVVNTPMQPDKVRRQDSILEPTDVAAAIVYAVSQPSHVNINTLQLQETANLV